MQPGRHAVHAGTGQVLAQGGEQRVAPGALAAADPAQVPLEGARPHELGEWGLALAPVPATLAAAAMTCVGSSVAVSTAIVDAPLFTVQAVRYALAAVLLVVVARSTGRRLPRPRGREWGWLGRGGADGTGAVQNVGVVRGVAHAEPAVIGVAVAAVPLVLAVAGPVVARRRPAAAVVAGAVVVTVGAALVSGGGRTDLAGWGWAAVVVGGEVAFTLLAVPCWGGWGRGRSRCTRCGSPRSRWRCSPWPSTGPAPWRPWTRATSSPRRTSRPSSPHWRSCSGTRRCPGSVRTGRGCSRASSR